MHFTKMHGAGNDYVYVDCTKETVENPSEVAKLVSDRHFGIGADGFSVWRLDEEFTVDPADFLSMGRATPFTGERFSGVNYLTAARNTIVYKKI